MGPIRGYAVDQLPVPHDVHDACIPVPVVSRVVCGNRYPAARGIGPRLHELAILVEDGHTLVVAVVDQDAAPGIQGDAVRELQLPRLRALYPADDPNELSVP